jgi:hypothetical protein
MVIMKRILFILLTFVSLSMSAQSISLREKAAIKQQYINFCKELNQQLPAQVDEMTTLNSMAFMNWTLTATYVVDIDANDVSLEDMASFKDAMHDTFKETAQKMFASGSYQVSRAKFRALMKVVGLKFRAIYKDAYNNFMFSVLLDYTDF